MSVYTWNDVEKAVGEVMPKEFNGANIEEFDVVLFGAGNAGSIALEELNERDITVAAFCDNDPQKHGTVINSIRCVSIEEVKKLKKPLVLITAIAYFSPIAEQLQALSLPYLFVDGYAVVINFDKLKMIYDDYLHDERSKHVFSALLLAKLYGTNSYCQEAYDDCFYYAIPSFKFLNPADVIVDCGAFVGDTIQELIEVRNKSGFDKIYAFEPGERQYKALCTRVKRLTEEWALIDEQITCVKAGVGKVSKKAYLNVENEINLNIAFVSDTPDESTLNSSIEIVALDEYFSDKNDKITFIKADVEGYEMDMLHGATNIIKKYKPNIALSIYHRWDDFFVIPEYLKSIVPEYNVSIRHHGQLFAETVCYCSVSK
jgi:FkbM family methyltransferase